MKECEIKVRQPVVSQPSKSLKFLTFREECFVIHFEYKHLSEALETLSPSALQKMKSDNISQLYDYDAPYCEQQYTHGSCYISLFKFKSFDQFNPPPPPPKKNCLKFWTFPQLWYYSCLHGVHQTSAICCLMTEVRPRVFRDFNTAFRSFVCFKRLDINNVISKRVISNYTFNIHFLMSEIISSSKKVHCY